MQYVKRAIPASVNTYTKRLLSSMLDARQWLLKQLPPNSIGVEIGVHEGEFAQRILQVVQPLELHLIDPWEYYSDDTYKQSWFGGQQLDQQAMDARYERVQLRFSKQIHSGQVSIYRAHSHELAATFDDHYFDWVYIDGNHLYDYVLQDLRQFYPKVKVGGYLLGDDYGVTGWWDDGVTQAVDQFVTEKSLHLETRGIQFLLRRL